MRRVTARPYTNTLCHCGIMTTRHSIELIGMPLVQWGNTCQQRRAHGLPKMWGDITQRGDNSYGGSTGATQTVHNVGNQMNIRHMLYIVNKPRHAISDMILYYKCQAILEDMGPTRPYARQ